MQVAFENDYRLLQGAGGAAVATKQSLALLPAADFWLSYPLVDKTNRPGITHGKYADADYGRPLNFYKTIAAVDFLAFVSSFRANISWLAPDPTPESEKLAAYYMTLMVSRRGRIR